MSAPMTVVTLVDEDGNEFPIRLPGVFVTNRAADYAAALHVLASSPELQPRGEVTLGTIEYLPTPL